MGDGEDLTESSDFQIKTAWEVLASMKCACNTFYRVKKWIRWIKSESEMQHCKC